MSATDLMNKFSKEHKTIAWVVDESGYQAGIVTMEDLLEEIFGDIKDEYDTEEFVENNWLPMNSSSAGRLELDYITERYKLEFPTTRPPKHYRAISSKITSRYPGPKTISLSAITRSIS